MPEVEFVNLLVIAGIALGAPLVVGLVPALRIPAVVLEIVLGVVVGPSVLGWVEIDLPVQILALIGLAFLLFLAGLEIDTRRLTGRLLGLATVAYLVTLVAGTLAGFGFELAGWTESPLLIAVALSATSLGLIVPVLKDNGHSDTDLGQTTIAACSVADFAAVVLLSLLFSMSGGGAGSQVVLLVSFAALVIGTGVVVTLVGRWRRLSQTLVRLQDTTAAIRVRAAVVLLIGFVALAEAFGLESILGAFLAGGLVGMLDRDTSTHPQSTPNSRPSGTGSSSRCSS